MRFANHWKLLLTCFCSTITSDATQCSPLLTEGAEIRYDDIKVYTQYAKVRYSYNQVVNFNNPFRTSRNAGDPQTIQDSVPRSNISNTANRRSNVQQQGAPGSAPGDLDFWIDNFCEPSVFDDGLICGAAIVATGTFKLVSSSSMKGGTFEQVLSWVPLLGSELSLPAQLGRPVCGSTWFTPWVAPNIDECYDLRVCRELRDTMPIVDPGLLLLKVNA